MNFLEIINKTTNIFVKTLSQSWTLILGAATINFVYQFLISIIVLNPAKAHITLLIYNIIAYPIIILFVMHTVKERVNHKNLLNGIKSLFKESQRCYGRILLYYTILTAIKMFVSFGTSFLLMLIVIIKLPFIEAGIFFNNLSLWQSTKTSFEKTQNNVLKVTLIFTTATLFSYFALIKASYVIGPLSLKYKSLSFLLGLITANIEILGKIVIISLFLNVQKNTNDNIQTAT